MPNGNIEGYLAEAFELGRSIVYKWCRLTE